MRIKRSQQSDSEQTRVITHLGSPIRPEAPDPVTPRRTQPTEKASAKPRPRRQAGAYQHCSDTQVLAALNRWANTLTMGAQG
jgi:hypothetical protein